MDDSRKTIYGIEVSRGVAALLVVFYHVSRLFEQNFGYFPFSKLTEIGHSGVDFFFVLSGFIIYFIHFGDVGDKRKLKPYLIKRVIRVLPIYWVVFILHLLLIPFVTSTDYPSFVGGFLQFFLLPVGMGDLVIGVSWTLQFEMAFYVLFGLFILNRAIGVLISFVWIVLIFMQFFQLQVIDLPIVTSAFCFQFIAGIIAAHVVLTYSSNRLSICFYIGLLALIGAWLAELIGLLNGYGQYARLIYALVFMLVVIGIFSKENNNPIKYSKVWLLLGKSSYSIYLTHLFFGGIYFKAMSVSGGFTFLPKLFGISIIIGLTVLTGIVFSKYVELPITKILRRKFINREDPA